MIRQNVQPDALPDFRNLGVIARIVIGAHLLALGAVVFAEPGWTLMPERYMRTAVLLEPVLLASLVTLYFASSSLARLPYWAGCASVLGLVLALAWAAHLYFAPGGGTASTGMMKVWYDTSVTSMRWSTQKKSAKATTDPATAR